MRPGVAPYPAAAALRRRAARQQANGEAFPPPPVVPLPPRRQTLHPRHVQDDSPPLKFSHFYCILSALASFLAIVTSPAGPASSTPSNTPSLFFENDHAVDLNTVENVAKAAAIGLSSDAVDEVAQQQQSQSSFSELDLVQSIKDLFTLSSTDKEEEETTHKKQSLKREQQQHQNVPGWFRWMIPPQNDDRDSSSTKESSSSEDGTTYYYTKNPVLRFFLSFVDPSILYPNPSSATDIIDKVLTSTPRLLAIANLLLAMTWLVHTAVVDIFLGSNAVLQQQDLQSGLVTTALDDATRHQHNGWAGRERLGGFLVFKLLLISAVVVPDTLDLLILLSWYTLLSFLRSLAHLAAATTAHTASSGQSPRRGVLRLLVAVLVSDVFCAAVCVALFHGAGWGMVLLLTCDCALLGVDVICHLLRHASQAMEERHSNIVREMEERQLLLHTQHDFNDENNSEDEEEEPATELTSHLLEHDEEEEEQEASNEDESRQLDRRMEVMETTHARRLAFLDTSVFLLQLLAYGLTVAHFLHIWSLHGLQFTLIDGVLALHLHSAISAAGKKIAERRNLNRIARALDGLFEDATELEMRKALACGDVCCICLGTMSAGHVKKVGCGHLYHTHCLREVVERARSIEAARCPLCRASVVDGRHSSSSGNNNMDDARNNNNNEQQPQDEARNNNNPDGQRAVAQPPQQQLNNNNAGEHALFRFSTENILPAWLPLPAFSFEVVRRPTTNAAPDAANDAANNNNGPADGTPQQSFWRRVLILAGAIPMSPEEEARALNQLVDMFPQYDRADLQRELRERGSAEAVVESVLQGVFRGVARGGGAPDARPQDEQDNVGVQENDEAPADALQ